MPYSTPPQESTFYAAFGAFTPLPNIFIDHAMPHLTDTEWRLLCVITRATLGWAQTRGESDERKSRDWLTHNQLIARTGRSSEAVSRALRTLVKWHLVEVQNERGELLLTPQERRRNGGKLFYGLHAQAKKGAQSLGKDTSSLLRPALDGTTKETENKKLPDGRNANEPSRMVDVFEVELDFWGKRSLASPEVPNPDVRRFLRAYRHRVRDWKSSKRLHNSWNLKWGRDGQLVRQLLQTYDYARLLALLDSFLAHQAKRQASFSLVAFRQFLDSKKRSNRGKDRAAPAVRHGRWIQAAHVRKKH